MPLERPHTLRSRIADAASLVGAAGVIVYALAYAPADAALFLSALGLSWLLVPPVADLARRLGAISLPGGRSITMRSTELLGGAAVFVPVLLTLGLAAYVTGDAKPIGLAVGSTLVFLVGALDDVRGVRPRTKVAVQVLAGLCLVAAGFRLPTLGIAPGISPLELGLVEYPLLLFWIVLATNAFNLIDGIDGLAASLAALAALACATLGIMPAAAFVVAGASMGFLRHNLPRATIFLGDCGSLVLGFLLAGILLEAPATVNVPVALCVFAYPLGDVTVAVLRRYIRGKRLFAGDRSHIHHKALEHLGGPGRALAALLVLAALPMLIVVLRPGITAVAVTAMLWVILLVALVRLGRVRLSSLSVSRRPLQQLYVLREYVERTITLAVDVEDVRRALKHMADSLGVAYVGIRGLQVHVEGVRTDIRHAVHLGDSMAEWAGAPLPVHDGSVLEEERETVVTDLLRRAASRLRALRVARSGGSPEKGTMGLAGAFGVPSPAQLRGLDNGTLSLGRRTLRSSLRPPGSP